MDKTTFMATLRADRALWDDLLAELLPLGKAALTAPDLRRRYKGTGL